MEEKTKRAQLKIKLRDPIIHWGISNVMASAPIANAAEDLSKPINLETAASRYFFDAGVRYAFNSLYRLGYSVDDFRKHTSNIKLPQFRPEKPL